MTIERVGVLERPEQEEIETEVKLNDITAEKVAELYFKTKELSPVDTVSIVRLSEFWEYPIELTSQIVYTTMYAEKSGDSIPPYPDWFKTAPIEDLYLQFSHRQEMLYWMLSGTNQTLVDIFQEINPKNKDYLEQGVGISNQVHFPRRKSSRGIRL